MDEVATGTGGDGQPDPSEPIAVESGPGTDGNGYEGALGKARKNTRTRTDRPDRLPGRGNPVQVIRSEVIRTPCTGVRTRAKLPGRGNPVRVAWNGKGRVLHNASIGPDRGPDADRTPSGGNPVLVTRDSDGPESVHGGVPKSRNGVGTPVRASRAPVAHAPTATRNPLWLRGENGATRALPGARSMAGWTKPWVSVSGPTPTVPVEVQRAWWSGPRSDRRRRSGIVAAREMQSVLGPYPPFPAERRGAMGTAL
jgi:hypothetical protein